MERKLVKQGKNALTITLPFKWIEQNNLTFEDTINISEKNNQLVISSNSNSFNLLEIKIDIKSLDDNKIFHQVIRRYIEGYDRIEILHNNFELIEKLEGKFLGMVFEEITNSKAVLGTLIKNPESNYNEIFRRTTQLLLNLVRSLKNIRKEEFGYNQIKSQERLLDKHIIYNLRYLNKYNNIEELNEKFLLNYTLESIGDNVILISKYIDKNINNISSDEEKTIEKLIFLIEKYIVFIIQRDFNKLFNLLELHKKEFESSLYIDGICASIRESMSNFIGYLIKNKPE